MRALATTFVLGLTACGGVDYAHPPPAPETLEGLQPAEPVAFTPGDDLLPSVSRSGRYVLFVSEQNGNLDIWVRDYQKDSVYPLTKESSADDYDPKIAPDGERMVFVTRRLDAKGDVFISDSNSESDIERLTDDATRDRQPVWGADGRFVYFTTARGIGRESIARIDRDSKAVTKVSPGYGFDPAVDPRGRYLVYTEPPVARGSAHPHLVALRLADGSTRAITKGETPEGFAAFVPPEHVKDTTAARILYVRFPDDDNGDGILDADDRASVWRIDVDLDAHFAQTGSMSVPIPLTDGNDEELFPTADDGWLYITKGTKQQDIVRYPIDGIFPRYVDPPSYLELAKTAEDHRTRWFILRLLHARAPVGSLLAAQATLKIANIHLTRRRPDLAKKAFLALRAETSASAPRSPEAKLGGLARVELVAIDHDERLETVAPQKRHEEIERTERLLHSLAQEYAWAGLVVARVDLEMAELLVDRGQRVRAIEALEVLTERHAKEPSVAARASLRRIELLQIAHDVAAIGEAYRRIARRYPSQREVVREASRRIVQVHVDDLGVNNSWTAQVDALRRIVPRYGESPARLEARWQLARLLEQQDALDAAALEYAQIIEESTEDRLGAARALSSLATIDERRERWDAAADAWRRLRSSYGDLPGFDASARDAITRVNMVRAAEEEARGNPRDAMAAYRRVIDNDVTQIMAHRRYYALSAQTGDIDDTLDEARRRAERSASTPVARYAYGLALTWTDPPELDDAAEEIEEAIRLNPQLAAAYITRGWIREMRERDPGVVSTVTQKLFATVGNMIGGLLDVEIGQRGELELALEDYKTALRLNAESVEPKLEAEILLNLGNAHYSLAQKTADVSNMRLAFDRYVEMQNLGYAFDSTVMEALFWERFGRSAIWAEEPAISAMATRRAIRFAERAGLSSRLGQLHGNLSLAYANAGEEAYARAALDAFGERLEARQQKERLIIAVRNRARAHLGRSEDRTTAAIDEALVELKTSRAILAEEGATPRGKTPDLWRGAITNHTSAQYGFRPIAELGLNLALAGVAHGALLEDSRVDALRRRRLDITQDVIDSSPAILLGIGDAEPVSLLQVRERVGLIAAEGRRALAAGDREGAAERYGAALAEIEFWRDDGRLASDFGALTVDRGRLVATMIEAEVAPEDVSPILFVQGAIAAIPVALDPARSATVGASLLTNEVLATLPETLSSTSALATTASIALAVPQLSGPFLDARAVRARLHHADALLSLRAAHANLRTGDALSDLLASLDGATENLDAARAAFERAVIEGAGAGPGKGGPVVVVGLLGLAETLRATADRRLVEPTLAAAREVARTIGRPDLQTTLSLATAWTGSSTAAQELDLALRERGPQAFLSAIDLYEATLVRTASAAISAGRTADAINVLDRWLFVHQAPRGVVDVPSPRAPNDAAAARSYHTLIDRLASLRRALANRDVSSTTDEHQSLLNGIAEAMQALADFEELAAVEFTELGLARSFLVPQSVDVLPFELTPTQIVIAPVPIDGRLHLAVVDGSTTAEQLAVIDTTKAFSDVVEARTRLWASIRAGSVDIEAVRILRAALVEPLAARLRDKRDVILAAAFLGGPMPSRVFELMGAAVSHVQTLSSVSLLTKNQIVGVEGTIVLEGERSVSMTSQGTRLSPDEALMFRRRPTEPAPEFGVSVALDERTAYERYAARAVRHVVVEAPISIEPAAVARSAVRLKKSQQTDDDGLFSAEADAFESELPLAALDLPATSLVMGRVTSHALGQHRVAAPKSWFALDLELAPKGFTTTVLVPDAVPEAAARRVIGHYLEATKTKAPAQALAEAIREERGRESLVELITLVGLPGLDAAGTKTFARTQVGGARSYAVDRLKRRKYREAVPALERWIRLQLEAENTKYLSSAYLALIGVLGDRLQEHGRAADAMERFVMYLDSTSKKERKKSDALVDLAYVYSRAQDYDKAEATFGRAIERLQKLDEQEGVARAWFKLARHYRDKLEFENAAKFMEQAIARYESLGQYKKTAGRRKEANLALVQVGDIYLNSLSDPVRARAAYERAANYASSDSARIDVTIDLARVARRRGDFDRAARLANEAREAAKTMSLSTREMSGVVEAANVAWYRGDYQQGESLCLESLELSNQMYATIAKTRGKKVKGVPSKRSVQQLEIYARSVCGLVAMSLRDFDEATQHLIVARRIAEAIDRPREVATQFNNLGRVFLEFDRREDAIAAFRSALAIDQRLDDRYALAYDLRNLGRALALRGDYKEALEALERGLKFAIAARDTNNELRARFALAERARATGEVVEATDEYRRALPLAQRLEVPEIAWQIHMALGEMSWSSGDLSAAERELRAAVNIVRTMTGRVTESAISPNRIRPVDALMSLLLDQKREAEALEIAALALSLEHITLVDDARVPRPDPRVGALLTQVRAASTATSAQSALTALAVVAPRYAELLTPVRPGDVIPRVPNDGAVVFYRLTKRELAIFVLRSEGLAVARVDAEAGDLERDVIRYAERLVARADLSIDSRRLSAAMLAPIAAFVSTKKRLAFVTNGSLGYVAMAALPFGDAQVVDRFVVTRGLDAHAAIRGLSAPMPAIAELPIRAFGAAAVAPGSTDRPLPFADKELQVIREAHPEAFVLRGDKVTAARVVDGLATVGGVVHFAGHTFFGNRRQAVFDPLGGRLRTSDGGVSVVDVLRSKSRAKLVVLSACFGLLRPFESLANAPAGEELVSFAQALHLAGVDHVLASTAFVDDLSAALVMKWFYRAAKENDAATALGVAQRAVRALHPHPAWWATFALTTR